MPEELNQIIVQKQDERLEEVLGTISNIRGQAVLIGAELDEQANFLQNMDEQMDITESRLKRLTRRIEAAYSSALDRNFNLVVNILIAVLIILLIVLIAI